MPVQPTETRPQIKVLPDALIDQIAAGEVVERPASVVKELVENALDAFATEIDVEIRQGGIEFIRVSDNGIGMSRDAALLALKRHATSKISSMDDLSRIASLGFRGEALPSIASVSRFDLVTRPLDSDEATRITVTGGRVTEVEAAGAAPGTTITVRDLFYNVPARRKFLKTAATESRRVAGWMTDLALSAPGVGFRYRSESRAVLNLAPHADAAARVGEVLGASLSRTLLPVDNRLDYVDVKGLIGRPDLAQSHRGRMYLYVNGRRIQDRSLVHALTAGYGEYLPDGRFPVAVLFLTLPPDAVDVNVHPTKAEVRFLHPRLVHDALYYTVNRTLTGSAAIASVAPGDPHRPVPTSAGGAAELIQKAAREILNRHTGRSGDGQTALWQSLYRPAPALSQGSTLETPATAAAEAAGRALPDTADATAVTGTDRSGRFYQFAQLYIVAPVADALIVMDQHTAHERILFEAVAERINAELTVTQNLLFPFAIELEPVAFETYTQNEDLFGRAGFQVRTFGHNTVLLEGAPAVLRGKSPDRYFREVLEMLASELKGGRDRLSALAASFACKAAVKAGDLLNEGEMAALFDQLFATRNPYTCPHGRPTVVRIPKAELDRKFGRA
jgi:DNA mismatch repair protein MutL